jgi:hypothetical protein
MKKFSYEEAKNHCLIEMEKMFCRIPFTREFHTGEKTQLNYYIRHVVEIILRIKLNNEVDAYSLYKIGYKDNFLSKKLATYLSEEYGHEAFFMSDLKSFGISENEVNEIKPFFSTKKLIGYLYFSIMQDGPMPTMVWNWLVEWYSDTYNMIITQKAANEFGEDKVFGSLKHLSFDESHDHLSLMFSTIEATVKSNDDEEKVKMYITNFIELIGEYYQELYDSTIAINEKSVLLAS